MQSAHRFSYTIIGDRGVGKTCLERQFTDGAFPEVHEPTIGVEFGTRTITVDDKRIKLYIWDTEGHESFVSLTKQYYYSAACIVLVYDITRRETFDHIATWLEIARNQSRPGVTLVLIGNKCDLSHMRAVSYEEGGKFAKKHNLVFMEASAKTTQNVEEAFVMTAETIYMNVEDGAIDVSERIMRFRLMGYGGVARSSCEGRNCCLVWCQKFACQFVGKPINWPPIGCQPAYLANFSKLGNFWQALEFPICWLANFWLSTKHALMNSWHKMGQWMQTKLRDPNDQLCSRSFGL